MNRMDLQPVHPVRPPAPYIGGKRKLAQHLGRLISSIPHKLYVEPFVGMGGVFFRRTRRPSAEVINDISGDVTTLFRILQRHYQPFLDTLKWQFSSRGEFERLLRQDPSTLTDLERAARFLYLQRMGFGGKVSGRAFGADPSNPARMNLLKLEPMLEDIHDRLAGVLIERLPFSSLINAYDRDGALFYLDPPYWNCETDYGKGVFDREDFQLLANLLAELKGEFILSINDTPEVRETFSGFEMVEVDLLYQISGGATEAKELIILPAGRQWSVTAIQEDRRQGALGLGG